MSIADFVTETVLRVRYAETDAMGIAHHASYVVWFEAGRTDYIRQRGKSYADLEAEGFRLVVAELGARFLAPAVFDEEVVVRTRLKSLRSRTLTFAYEVLRKTTGEKLATGYTTHICTDHQGRVRLIPPAFRAMIEGNEAKLR